MATNAERQRRYRERLREGNEAERVDLVLSIHAKRQLERLASHYGTTQRTVMEWLLGEAEARVVNELPQDEHRKYYDR